MDLLRIQRRLKAARGQIPADLVLAGGLVAGLHTGEWRRQDVAIYDGVVVGLGEYPGLRLDVSGKYILPGLIDGHLHLESSMLTPPELARALLPLGTTTVVIDPHEIANVMGVKGLKYMLEASEGLPLDVFVMLPSCVPASGLETSGARLDAGRLKGLVRHPRVLGLAEVMNFPGLISGDAALLEKINLFPGRPIDGHAPLLSGRDLQAYRVAGVGSDHECTQLAEAQEKLAAGFYLMIREGSLARNLADLLPAVTPFSRRRCLLVTDDSHPESLAQGQHLNRLLAKAVAHGLDPLDAVALATLNPAEYFGLRDRGAVAPGMKADLVAVDDIKEFPVHKVWKNGRLAADQGRLVETPMPQVPAPPTTFRVRKLSLETFFPRVQGDRIKVIGLVPGQLLTEKRVLPAPLIDGRLKADPTRDLLKLAVVERHRATGNVGLGMVQGFGLKRGALASSVAHDSHNIVVVGVNEEDMLRAVEHLVSLGGGMAVVADGRVLADLPLPIAGLISLEPLEKVAPAYTRLNDAYHNLGGTLPDAFMALSFLALPVIPALKLTDLGLVDVGRFEIVPLFGAD